MRGIDDLAQNQVSSYAYDVRGLRVQETLSKDGALVRDQTNSYNSRGWLVGVNTEASVSFGGSTLSEPISVFFRYDQAGNRVWMGDNHYVYDGENRMLLGFDGKSHQVVEAMQYDGYGNRVSIQQAGTTTTYSYSCGAQKFRP